MHCQHDERFVAEWNWFIWITKGTARLRSKLRSNAEKGKNSRELWGYAPDWVFMECHGRSIKESSEKSSTVGRLKAVEIEKKKNTRSPPIDGTDGGDGTKGGKTSPAS